MIDRLNQINSEPKEQWNKMKETPEKKSNPRQNTEYLNLINNKAQINQELLDARR